VSVIAFPADRLHGRREARRTDHPSAPVELFDWATHSDKPPMPTLIACALDRVGQHLANPLQVSRAQAVEALTAIRAHYRSGSDDCNPHGMPRPS
jgi:hypothetical protein